MIRIDNLSKRPDLKKVSLVFEDRVLCVLSTQKNSIRTLFSVMCDNLLPDSGTLLVEGKPIPLLPSGVPIPKNIRVSDYISFVSKLCGVSEPPNTVNKLIGDLEDSKVRTLTGLEKVKVGIASLLIPSPECIILEDPTSILSSREYHKFCGIIHEISENVTVIMSCDIPTVFEEISDKLLVLSGGRVIEYGDTDEIIKRAKTNGTITCKIKGDIEKIRHILKYEGINVSETERSGVCIVTLPETENIRKELKKTVSKAGMALLSMKSDNDDLRNVIDALSRTEDAKRNTETDDEEDENDINLFSSDILSFNHSSDDQDEDEAEEDSSPEKEGLSISNLFAHSDDDESDDGESTLFS